VPPEASQLVTELSTEKPNATFKKYEYNVSSRTINLEIRVTNPYAFNLVINALSADVECTAHHVYLGKAYCPDPQSIPAKSTASIVVALTWDEEAATHTNINHSDQSSIFVDLAQLTADVQGVNVQLQDRISLPDAIPIG
jgi:LEA14-like dessication related protein